MKHKNGIPNARRRDWSKVDWTQNTTRLAKKLGVSASQVSIARRKFAPETLSKSGTEPHIDWSKVDWSMKQADIARAHGISRQAVWAKRQELIRKGEVTT